MLNRKTTLGKNPITLGDKDAVHVAIVSVRAATFLKVGEKVRLNGDREAIKSNSDDAIGIVDPFLDSNPIRGESFWMIMLPDKVEKVNHVWEYHEDLSPPTTPPKQCRVLKSYADDLKISYEELMKTLNKMATKEERTLYTGPLNEEELEEVQSSLDDLWYYYSEETGHEFPNYGTYCCPETDYPSNHIFKVE